MSSVRPTKKLKKKTAKTITNNTYCMLLQQEELSHQIAEIEATIQRLTQSVSNTQNMINPTSYSNILSSASPQLILTNITPLRQRRWQTSIGEPYPLPFRPPRTPEVEHHNNIITWINELWLQNYSKNGEPK